LKAFTIIETLIATALFFVASVVFLNIFSNKKFGYIQKYNNFLLLSTIALIEDFDTKNLYEKTKLFKIDDKEIRDFLKQDIETKESEVRESKLENVKVLLLIKKAFNTQFSNSVYKVLIK
jgi:hypothetical protein